MPAIDGNYSFSKSQRMDHFETREFVEPRILPLPPIGRFGQFFQPQILLLPPIGRFGQFVEPRIILLPPFGRFEIKCLQTE